MQALAPNLTALVGELVGARLIAHAGSLMNLAKSPGSTIQILGAEKALFRALKTKHDTPKYGVSRLPAHSSNAHTDLSAHLPRLAHRPGYW
jgi:RNA processing factor Prp31